MEFQNAETDCVELAKKDVANQLNVSLVISLLFIVVVVWCMLV